MSTGINVNRNFVALNIICIISILLLLPLGGAIWALLGLFFLGIMQFIAALIAALRGNRAMGYYLLASVIFLFFYFGALSGFITFLDPITGHIPEELLLSIPPLCMAAIFTVLLILRTNEVARPTLSPADELLDDEVF